MVNDVARKAILDPEQPLRMEIAKHSVYTKAELQVIDYVKQMLPTVKTLNEAEALLRAEIKRRSQSRKRAAKITVLRQRYCSFPRESAEFFLIFARSLQHNSFVSIKERWKFAELEEPERLNANP